MIAKNPPSAPTGLSASFNDCLELPSVNDRSYPAVLLVTGLEADMAWVPETLRAGGPSLECLVEVAPDAHTALGTLHVQPFHALVVRHTPPAADARELLEALPLAGADVPVVVLIDDISPEEFNHFYELGVEAVLSLDGLVPQTLTVVVKRAIDRFDLVRENQRLSKQERRMIVKDRDEAEHFLEQQRSMIRDLEAVAVASQTALSESQPPLASPGEVGLSAEGPEPEFTAHEAPLPRFELPENLVIHYRELLRTFVIMGSGSLAGDIGRLSQMLADTGTSPCVVMGLHLKSVESLVCGLGRRSSRHVMSRAHLLALELMAHLAKCYQQALQGPHDEVHKS